MPRDISLTFRAALQAQQSDVVGILLVIITHPALASPAYLSSDPTQRLSVEPLMYGTMHQGILFPFVLASAVLPDDQDGTPPKTSLRFQNVDRGIVEQMRSITSPATVELRVVTSDTPDTIEARYTDLRAVRATFEAGEATLEISREPWTAEPFPSGRMTQDKFPGLH